MLNESDSRNHDMISRRKGGEKLVKAEIAIAIVRLIQESVYGIDELRKQEPLRVENGGDVWIIRGSNPHEIGTKTPNVEGALCVVMSQFDCSILKYVEEYKFEDSSGI